MSTIQIALDALKRYLAENNPEGFGCACDPSGHICGPCQERIRQKPLLAAVVALEAVQVDVPENVMQALDRMCTPLHESRMRGVTAEADARNMKVIRDYIFSTAPKEAVQVEPERNEIDAANERAFRASEAHVITMGKLLAAETAINALEAEAVQVGSKFTLLRAKGVVDADNNLDCWDTSPYEICTRHVEALNGKDPASMWRVVDLYILSPQEAAPDQQQDYAAGRESMREEAAGLCDLWNATPAKRLAKEIRGIK